ncbi:DUF1318 domain-containing protein [Desulfohalovibrio reitneri]|uniref:DUF1318 domain-containing protein n=1 Tax=Desulfohalovibrio reitneri TaxID=1307759 RepID=UPI0004A7596C|nr:DUF1318 domain-containing protein [Desulfohalovibrio reitneri]
MRKYLAALALLFAAACVTVNIYFPAAKVEKTADEIVSDVYGQERAQPEGEQESSLAVMLASLFTVAEAHAQEATSVSNAAIRGLKDELRQNNKKLQPYFRQGAVGIGNDGMLHLRDTSGLSLKDKATVRQLVQRDNQTRRQLYKEVSRALNIDPSQEGKVADIFADKWRSEAPSGYPVQSDGGSWSVK